MVPLAADVVGVLNVRPPAVDAADAAPKTVTLVRPVTGNSAMCCAFSISSAVFGRALNANGTSACSTVSAAVADMVGMGVQPVHSEDGRVAQPAKFGGHSHHSFCVLFVTAIVPHEAGGVNAQFLFLLENCVVFNKEFCARRDFFAAACGLLFDASQHLAAAAEFFRAVL